MQQLVLYLHFAFVSRLTTEKTNLRDKEQSLSIEISRL